MLLVFPFPGTSDAPISAVGGKARSLILMSGAGLNVPPGFALSTEFFSPWLCQIRRDEHFHRLKSLPEEQLRSGWQALKESCQGLTLDADLREVLFKSFETIAGTAQPGFQVAVRSSAPEEDLEGASFAGGYLSIMGVTRPTLEDAIRQAFLSCLDYRVFVYKRMRGFDPLDPRIAVVVQQQIDSEIAGVGFSLNPLTNDFDEAVINSNWGLGETVVAGLSTPDTYVVDKVSLQTVKSTLGSKETSLWLSTSDQSTSRQNYRADEWTLQPEEIVRVTRLICEVEKHFRKAMDIEWSLAKNELWLLQARPITAFVPVPPDMVTAPGEPRRLYLDATISVQSVTRPISVMGTASLKRFIGSAVQKWTGPEVPAFALSHIARFEQGRLYADLSAVMKLFGKEGVVNGLRNMDSIASAIIQATDAGKYVDSRFRVPWKVRLGFLHAAPAIFSRLCCVLVNPERAHQRSQEAFARYRKELDLLPNAKLSFRQYTDTVFQRTILMAGVYSGSLFVSSKLAQTALKRIFPNEPLTALLDKALPHNKTVEMGLDLSGLAAQLPAATTREDLEDGFYLGTLPTKFMADWHEFLEQYGHRGPLEIDVASPRYRDDPEMLFSQLSALTTGADPSIRHKRAQAERETAWESLVARTRGVKRIVSCYLYRVLSNLGGYRETHKYFIAMAMWFIRRRVLTEAGGLVATGRLDSVKQAFDLTIEQLSDGLENQELDLRAIARKNSEFIAKLAAVPMLPQVFDSRGRILSPPVPTLKPGELAGAPISTGSATGPVKVLASPYEKPFLSGDVLVARATDPGWTPLFASASAVILEVGGLLQHGALVAREYGLPCVAGVSNATALLKDGNIVEVDGTAGIIRIIQEASTDSFL